MIKKISQLVESRMSELSATADEIWKRMQSFNVGTTKQATDWIVKKYPDMKIAEIEFIVDDWKKNGRLK